MWVMCGWVGGASSRREREHTKEDRRPKRFEVETTMSQYANNDNDDIEMLYDGDTFDFPVKAPSLVSLLMKEIMDAIEAGDDDQLEIALSRDGISKALNLTG